MFFQKHSVMTETQYGFQNIKSTSHAILDVLMNAYDNIESNGYTVQVIVLLDFKKAFDAICHSICTYHYNNFRGGILLNFCCT